MPTRFFLNALREEGRQLPNPGEGVWASDAHDNLFLFLQRYAHDIRADEIDDPNVVHSVPSVFARPIQFWRALADKEHPLHRAIAGEWRGLLALFALQRHLNLKLELVRFDVSRAQAGVTTESKLEVILRNQLPQPESDWETWWLLYCDAALIGATSPWSIVYTPAQYRCPACVPWRTDDGRLCDPGRFFDPERKGRSAELALLYKWVERVLQEHPWGLLGIQNPISGGLKGALEEWMGELQDYPRQELVFRELNAQPLVEEQPYSHFLGPRFEGGPEAFPSDLLLGSGKAKALGGVLVLAGTPPARAMDRVWGSVFAGQLDVERLPGPEGPGGWKTPDGRTVKLSYVKPAEAFFPPKLAAIRLSADALQRGADDVAIPLTPLFFKYFDLQDLINLPHMLEVQSTRAEVMVKLRLPLERGRTLEFKKTYRRDVDVIMVEGAVPAMALWPDFLSSDWRHNFAAFAAPHEPNLRVAPVTADGVEQTPKSAEDGSQNYVRIWKADRPLVGFQLYAAVPGEQDIACGMVLRDLKRDRVRLPERDRQKSWTVAFDFGTSNSAVMIQDEGGSRRLLEFEPRLCLLTSASEGDKTTLTACVAPDFKVKPPFPTLLYGLGAIATVFPRGADVLGFELYPAFAPYLTPDVKWGSAGGGERSGIKAYLEGLLRYAACEARASGVGTLKLRWSYPLSLPTRSYNTMKEFWNSANAWIGLDIAGVEGWSESEAIKRCLAQTPRIFPAEAEGSLSVAVDVGGGSTDVAMWSGGHLLDQFSMKVAANDVLSQHWLRLPHFLERLFGMAEATSLTRPQIQLWKERTGIAWNLWLSQTCSDMGVRMLREGGGLAPWIYLRTMVYLFFSGVFFYLGLHGRKHVSQRNIHQVNAVVGGRGSQLLSWLTLDSERLRALCQAAVGEGLGRGLLKGDERSSGCDRCDVKVNGFIFKDKLPKPKEEVVEGLLVDAEREQPQGRKTTTLVGEEFWEFPKGKKVDWDEEMEADLIGQLSPPPDHESGFVAQFLKLVLPKYIEELNLDSNVTKLKLDGPAVQQLAKAAAGEAVVQPLFGFELKVLLDTYVENVVRSASAPAAAAYIKT